jgi:hypothetical protein
VQPSPAASPGASPSPAELPGEDLPEDGQPRRFPLGRAVPGLSLVIAGLVVLILARVAGSSGRDDDDRQGRD